MVYGTAVFDCRYKRKIRVRKDDGEGVFEKKRTWKLLLPSTAGLFVYQWAVGYYNVKIGGGLAYIPNFLVYPVSVVSGIGPLWFVQVLWLYSLLILFIRKMDKRDRLWELGGRCNLILCLVYGSCRFGMRQKMV